MIGALVECVTVRAPGPFVAGVTANAPVPIIGALVEGCPVGSSTTGTRVVGIDVTRGDCPSVEPSKLYPSLVLV